jgi:glucose/arabinose dehydrogenase
VPAIQAKPSKHAETPELPDGTPVKLLPPAAFFFASRAVFRRAAGFSPITGFLRAARAQALRASAALLLAATALPVLAALPVERIKLPPGFHIEVLSDAIPSARAMALSPKGIVYIGSLDGHVYALELQNGRVTARHVIASGLETPAGVAWRDGTLYVSAVSKILRFDAIDAHLNDPPKPVVITDSLPTETHHGWKFIAFGPDGKLYVPQGAPCNVCLKDRDRFGMIGRMDPDGSHYEVVARGIRNTVGFAWHPVTHELWFTDNGRDLMGDDVPDDKLNRAPRAGMDFGFPYCHGGDTPDPEFGKDHPCSAFTPPVVKLGAHVAAIGMRFYSGSMFPAAYRNNIFIAEHGSWNRSKKVGYRVVRVITNPDGSSTRQEVFAEGWLQPGESVWGRPADVQPMPDGSLLISDDYAGAVYRVTYSAPQP